MKAQFLTSLLFAVKVWAEPLIIQGIDVHADWKQPIAGEVRTPCPMLNALANHGFINRAGKNITREMLKPVLMDVVGFNEEVADILFNAGRDTTGNPENDHFDFADVNVHGPPPLLEHDGSLSREDAYYGDQVSFSPHAFAQTLLYMPNDTINLQQSANARLSRVMTTNATNPEWSQREGRVQQLSFGESLLYITVLGNPQKYELRKDYFRYFFEQERLPYALGWRKKTEPIARKIFIDGIQMMKNMTGSTFPLPSFDDSVKFGKRTVDMLSLGGHLGF